MSVSLFAPQPSNNHARSQRNACRHMSAVREPSPTSKFRDVQESSARELPGGSHLSLALSSNETSTKQLAFYNGGRDGAFEAASFAGTGKRKSAGKSKTENPQFEDPTMPNLSPAAYETNKKNRISRPPPTEWKPSTPHIAALLAVSRTLPVQSTGRIQNPPPGRTNVPKMQPDFTAVEMQTDKQTIPHTASLIKIFEPQKEEHDSHPSGGLFDPQTSRRKGQSSAPTRPARTRSVTSEVLRQIEKGKSLEGSNASAFAPVSNRGSTPKTSENNINSLPKSPSSGKPEELKIIALRRGPAPPPPPPRRHRKGDNAIAQDRQISSTVTHSPAETSSPSTSLFPNQPSDQPQRPWISPSTRKNKNGKEHHNWAVGRHSRESTLDPRSRTPQLTADSLADAMVASSLASSRASSPSKPTPPLPRRQSKAQSIFRRSQSQELVQSRTPSPGRVLRQTMRETPKSDEEVGQKRTSGNILNKHPNKHHEGDRKRWRDEIAERERKRYEGVWAANKGLLVPSELPDANSTVLNLVVRDIWCRSRLPSEVLAEVWDLVDNSHVGRLSKEEFVVGMWLIDQRLKGRKLPVKVSESVWFSVKRLSGLKAPK